MAFPQAQARLQDAVFSRLGENATWAGITGTVRIIRRQADERFALERGNLIEAGAMLRVRKVDVEAPAIGHAVQVLDDDGDPLADASFTISGEPELDRKGVWHCPIVPAA